MEEKNGFQIRLSPTNSLIEIFHQISTSLHVLFKGVRKFKRLIFISICNAKFNRPALLYYIFSTWKMSTRITEPSYMPHNELCEIIKAAIKLNLD